MLHESNKKSSLSFLLFGFLFIFIPSFLLFTKVLASRQVAVDVSVNVVNSLPITTEVEVNGNASFLTLAQSGNVFVQCAATIIDLNICDEIASASYVFYRSDVSDGVDCAQNSANCYKGSCVVNNDCAVETGDLTKTANCVFPVASFSDATYSGAAFASTDWTCAVIPYDAEGAGIAASDTIEVASYAQMYPETRRSLASRATGSSASPPSDAQGKTEEQGKQESDTEIEEREDAEKKASEKKEEQESSEEKPLEKEPQEDVAGLPVVSSVSVDALTQTAAVIRWTTNVDTFSTLEYGLESGIYNLGSYPSKGYSQKHEQKLTHLSSGTEYHFHIIASIPTAQSVSPDYSFVTKAPVEPQPALQAEKKEETFTEEGKQPEATVSAPVDRKEERYREEAISTPLEEQKEAEETDEESVPEKTREPAQGEEEDSQLIVPTVPQIPKEEAPQSLGSEVVGNMKQSLKEIGNQITTDFSHVFSQTERGLQKASVIVKDVAKAIVRFPQQAASVVADIIQSIRNIAGGLLTKAVRWRPVL